MTRDRINWAKPGGWQLYGKQVTNIQFHRWNLFWYNSSTGVGRHPDKRLLPFTDNDVIKPDGTIWLQAMPDYKNLIK